jgi:pilus assembly protein CpaB
MNPMRVVLLNLSKIPPVVMLSTVVGLAAVTALTVSNQLDSSKKQSEAAQQAMENKLNEKTKAVFALKDIPEGQMITSEALEEREIPKAQMPLDAINASSLAAGRTAKYGIIANSIVSQHDLAAEYTQQGFESKLKPGQRAITFGVDNNSGVAGFINPQSRIDILASIGGAGDTKVAPILSDVQVIAVGATYQKAAGSTNNPTGSITVAVDPDDAKKLVKAIVASKLYVTLRNEKDRSPVATVDVTSMFNKPSTKIASDTLAQLPPPMPLPVIDNTNNSNDKLIAGQIAPPLPPPLHEIEMWSGSRKDVMSTPTH